MPQVGIIGGSGLYDIPGLEITDSAKLTSPYGEPSDVYRIGRLAGREVAFLPRHGSMHHIQPHKINYRANIWGFRELGVERIVSVGASGGISKDMKPGLLALPDQIIDMTSGRASTFYDEDEVIHVDFTEPFCTDTRRYLLDAAQRSEVGVHESGVYVCVNGPRLETAAEIKTFSLWGADMVGMTAMPEASLARELEICYAGISVITNYAAGISDRRLTATEVVETMQAATERIKLLLKAFLSLDFREPACSCKGILRQARM
jgi:5'-methylthioadenosine phosphorylase